MLNIKNLPTSNLLTDFYQYPSQAGANPISTIYPKLQTQTLPNGGGSYNPAGTSAITPAPIFTGIKPVSQTKYPAKQVPKRNFCKNGNDYYYADTNQKILNPDELKAASQFGVEVATPTSPTQTSSFYDKYRDPSTGQIMTPTEYANYLASKIPQGNGEISNYAGDALANPNQTETGLVTAATNLNNSRNDIATGTTDPYNVASQSGIAYSPAELKAIENAYAGIYDPALNDAFTRLKATQDAQAEELKQKQAEAKAIQDQKDALERLAVEHGYSMELKRTPGASSADGSSKILSVSDAAALGVPYGTTESQAASMGIITSGKNTFSKTQLDKGAVNAGMDLSSFEALDDDVKNIYINSPKTVKDKIPIYKVFENDYKDILDGNLNPDQVTSDINSSNLSDTAKQYFISKIPAQPQQKEGWLQQVGSAIRNAFQGN